MQILSNFFTKSQHCLLGAGGTRAGRRAGGDQMSGEDDLKSMEIDGGDSGFQGGYQGGAGREFFNLNIKLCLLCLVFARGCLPLLRR